MSPQSLLGVIFALFLVSTWTILNVRAQARSPERSRPGQVALEQSNVMPAAPRAHRTSQVAYNEVALALRANQGKDSRGKRLTQPTDCIQLVNRLLVEPSPPIPTIGWEVKTRKGILRDCITVWKQLEDKAKNDLLKHTSIKYELGLLTARLGEFEDLKKSSNRKHKEQSRTKEKESITKCNEVLLRIPLNLEVGTTKQSQVQHKTELVECSELWKRLIGRQDTIEVKVVRLKQELGRMDEELARVKRMLRTTSPELDDIDFQESAFVNQPSTSGQGQSRRRGQKQKKSSQVDLQSSGQGQANKAIDKRAERLRAYNRKYQFKMLRGRLEQESKCIQVLHDLNISPSPANAKSGEHLLLYLAELETCAQLWDKHIKGVSKVKSEKKPKAELVQELAQMKAEIALVNRLIDARKGGRDSVAQSVPSMSRWNFNNPQISLDDIDECRRMLQSFLHQKLPSPPRGVSHKDHYENASRQLMQCLDWWTNAVKSGNAQLARERDQFTVAYKKANLLALRAYRFRQYHPPMGTY